MPPSLAPLATTVAAGDRLPWPGFSDGAALFLSSRRWRGSAATGAWMDETRSTSRRTTGRVLVTDGAPDDVRDRLVARVAELERSHLAEDVEGFVSLFLPHAVWVTVAARRLTGREAIEEFAAGVLPGAFQAPASVWHSR